MADLAGQAISCCMNEFMITAWEWQLMCEACTEYLFHREVHKFIRSQEISVSWAQLPNIKKSIFGYETTFTCLGSQGDSATFEPTLKMADLAGLAISCRMNEFVITAWEWQLTCEARNIFSTERSANSS